MAQVETASLAGRLGGLRLALERAAAYAQATGMSLAAYLALFRRRRADMLDRGQAAGHATVAATLSLAMSRLGAESPAADGLLRLLAFMAPEPVPVDLIFGLDLAGHLPDAASDALGPMLGDHLALADAVAALRALSLISPAGPGVVLGHRLVQDIAKTQLPSGTAQAWEQTAAALVDLAAPADPQVPQSWPACAVLLPLAEVLLGMTSEGIWRIATGIGHSGSYAVAVDLFRQIASAYENDPEYGPEHPDTLAARGNFARWTGDAGDPARTSYR